MKKDENFQDLVLLVASFSSLLIGGLLWYWLGQIEATLTLLELAYGSISLFNNPLAL